MFQNKRSDHHKCNHQIWNLYYNTNDNEPEPISSLLTHQVSFESPNTMQMYRHLLVMDYY